jgi:hypothetical protein
MVSQHPAVAFLLAAHSRAEEDAQFTDGEFVSFDVSDERTADHYRGAGSPAAVLRRIAGERKLLASHEPSWSGGEPEYGCHMETVVSQETGRTRYVRVRDEKPVGPYWCEACQAVAPCPVWLGLAAAWGLPCGETAVFWPDVEACDAVCVRPTGHDGDHEDEILGPWEAA